VGEWGKRGRLRCGLDYGEIGADNVGGGVGFRWGSQLELSSCSGKGRTEINSPYPSTSRDLGDILRI
jgi:hypothetical protein